MTIEELRIKQNNSRKALEDHIERINEADHALKILKKEYRKKMDEYIKDSNAIAEAEKKSKQWRAKRLWIE
jgi:hypothetical protein